MRSTTAAFCDQVFEPLLGIPKSTAMHFAQALRQDETIFRRGKQGFGAVEPTAAEVANWLIALVAATAVTRKSPDPIDTVKFARAAVRLSGYGLDIAPEGLDDLAIANAATFGEALDTLIADMRSGVYARWQNGWIANLNIRFFNNGGRIVINLDRHALETGERTAAAFVYRSENPADSLSPCLTFVHELDGFALQRIAEILGPLTEALPPPPY